VSSQTEESKALLHRITDEIWNKGHLELIDELISEDLVDHIDASSFEGTGPERYRNQVTALRGAFPDYREEIVWIVAEGDRAVSFVRATGTHLGPLHGVEPTGRKVEFNAMGALRFSSGQLVERWGFADSGRIGQQLGLSWLRDAVPPITRVTPGLSRLSCCVPGRCSYGLSRANADLGSVANISRAT
jgi:predicted ester cyclase